MRNSFPSPSNVILRKPLPEVDMAFHLLQGVVVVRVEVEPRRARAQPETVVIATLFQYVDVEFPFPLPVVGGLLPAFGGNHFRFLGLDALVVARYVQ